MPKTFEGYGYTPGHERDRRIMPPPTLTDMLPKVLIDPSLLPPVGTQGTGDNPGKPGTCCAWATTYGLATWYAAKYSSLSPLDLDNQASPANIYIQVLLVEGASENCCADTYFSDYFDILQSKGTVSMQQAGYTACCTTLWTDYNPSLPPNEAFVLDEIVAFDARNLIDVKTCIAWGLPVVFAMQLYDNWKDYGQPGNCAVPYKGDTPNGLHHCLFIIGYCDKTQAFLVQNSQGASWGTNVAGSAGGTDCGYVWIGYETFQQATERYAYYVSPTNHFDKPPSP